MIPGLFVFAPSMDKYDPLVKEQLHDRDYKAVLETIRPLVLTGNIYYLVLMGWMYYRGKGVPQDKQKSKDYFKQSAELGNPEGYYYLGLLEHLSNNQAKAVEYYSLSVEHGSTYGLYELGLIYIQGVGVMRNPSKAYQLFLEAEENKNILAMRARAYFLINDYFEKGFVSKLYGYLLLLKCTLILPFYALKDPFRYDGLDER